MPEFSAACHTARCWMCSPWTCGPTGARTRRTASPLSDAASAMAGRRQIDWLQSRLLASTAAWKVIASDCLSASWCGTGRRISRRSPTATGPRSDASSSWPGCLASSAAKIRNVVWVTGGCALRGGHRYEPERAQFKDFDAFHEFVAAAPCGHRPACPLDNTFGPQVLFNSVPATLTGYPGPADGLQFFGMVKIAHPRA